MTIGKYGYDPSKGPNPDYLTLADCRDSLAQLLNISQKDIILSMGTTTDFEQAVRQETKYFKTIFYITINKQCKTRFVNFQIELGSGYIRVGTLIFGPEMPRKQKEEVEEEED